MGWTIGRNLRIDHRWAAGDSNDARKYAVELAALSPDLILASGFLAVAAAQQTTPPVPIVFVNIVDPVSAGLVESLARPGGNTTGFLMFEYATGGKWVELLKQIAPDVTRVAVLRDISTASGSGQLGAIQSAASQLGIEFRPIGVRDAAEIERGITDFVRGSNGGLIVSASPQSRVHRELITALARRHRLPSSYYSRIFVDAGGLISYGPSTIDSFRRAASYVDRILKGEKPADLPAPRVHQPSRERGGQGCWRQRDNPDWNGHRNNCPLGRSGRPTIPQPNEKPAALGAAGSSRSTQARGPIATISQR